jgi:uncharacterized repeat protein (TIGR03837 family)
MCRENGVVSFRSMLFDSPPNGKTMQRWDIFCRVVDNFGDIGTCWRLAQQLAGEHDVDVRLWVDDLDRFARLCPDIATDAAEQRVGPIDICHWQSDFTAVDVADVVIEAFACEIPESYIRAMALRKTAPAWINLEYLSAEAWVEDCHLLTSPHPRFPLTKWFFFPGFTSKTGSLLRERELLARREAFDSATAAHFWNSVGVPSKTDDELRISLFCYENPSLPKLLGCWAEGENPVRVLAAPGAATQQVSAWLGVPLTTDAPIQTDSLTVHAMSFLPQNDYDRLLWACDVNFVRGEDSFVRAQWALRPFVWQIYPQAEQIHHVKLDAFLARYLGEFKHGDSVRGFWQAWNGIGDVGSAWRDFIACRQSIERHGKDWVDQLDHAGDLANNLVRFVREKIGVHR